MTFTSAVIDLKNSKEDRVMMRPGDYRSIFIFMNELQIAHKKGHFTDPHLTVDDYIADDWITTVMEDEDPD